MDYLEDPSLIYTFHQHFVSISGKYIQHRKGAQKGAHLKLYDSSYDSPNRYDLRCAPFWPDCPGFAFVHITPSPT